MQTESKRIKSFKLSTLLLPGYSRLILLFLFILAICPTPSIFASPHLGAWSADDVLLISEWRKLLGGCRTFELEDLIDIIDISTIISDIILDIGISLIWKLDISDSILAFSADIKHSKQVGPLVKNSEGRSPSRGALPGIKHPQNWRDIQQTWGVIGDLWLISWLKQVNYVDSLVYGI